MDRKRNRDPLGRGCVTARVSKANTHYPCFGLELNPKAELDVPGRERPVGEAERAAGQVTVDACQVDVVKDVEELGAEFQLSSLFPHEPRNFGSLEGGEVRVDIPWPDERVAAEVT